MVDSGFPQLWKSGNVYWSGHFTTGQKAAYVFAMWEWEAEKAKERMESGRNQHSPPEMLPEGKGDTRDRLGQKVGISGKSVDKFRKIEEVRPKNDGLTVSPSFSRTSLSFLVVLQLGIGSSIQCQTHPVRQFSTCRLRSLFPTSLLLMATATAKHFVKVFLGI